jgi:hypothetical protein
MGRKNCVNPQMMRRVDPDSWRKRPSIEHKFAAQKKYHGLRQATALGRALRGTDCAECRLQEVKLARSAPFELEDGAQGMM